MIEAKNGCPFFFLAMDFYLEYIYEQYVELSEGSSDEEEYSDETAMMQAVLEDAERAEEHVLNFKGSIKGHRVLKAQSFDTNGRQLCPLCTIH